MHPNNSSCFHRKNFGILPEKIQFLRFNIILHYIALVIIVWEIMLSLVPQKISGAVIHLSTSAFLKISKLHAVQTYYSFVERTCEYLEELNRFILALQLRRKNHQRCLTINPLCLKARKLGNLQWRRTSFIARSVLSHRRTYGENFPNEVTHFEIAQFGC